MTSGIQHKKLLGFYLTSEQKKGRLYLVTEQDSWGKTTKKLHGWDQETCRFCLERKS